MVEVKHRPLYNIDYTQGLDEGEFIDVDEDKSE
jgi:hypothetical protein